MTCPQLCRRPAANLRLILTLLVTLAISPLVFAGPPMVLDDTGTASPGSWEVILYGSGEHRDSNHTAEFPGVDVAYGIADRWEFSFLIPYQLSDGEPVLPEAGLAEAQEADDQVGFGNAVFGLKWRFFEGERTAVAISPVLSLPLSSIAQIRGLVDDAVIFEVPLVASWTVGRWELTGQVAYAWANKASDAVVFGAGAGYPLADDFRVMGEVYGLFFPNGDSAFSNWRLGMEWAVHRRVDLLAAYGGPMNSNLPPEDRLRRDFYLGVLLRF
jgi:hypothetical protein